MKNHLMNVTLFFCGLYFLCVFYLYISWTEIDEKVVLDYIVFVGCFLLILTITGVVLYSFRYDEAFQKKWQELKEKQRQRDAKVLQCPEEVLFQKRRKEAEAIAGSGKLTAGWFVWTGMALFFILPAVLFFGNFYEFPLPDFDDVYVYFYLGCIFVCLIIGFIGILIHCFRSDKTTLFQHKIKSAIWASGLCFRKLDNDKDWREQLAVIKWAVAHKDELKKREKDSIVMRLKKSTGLSVTVEDLLTDTEKMQIMYEAGFHEINNYLFRLLWFREKKLEKLYEIREELCAQGIISSEDAYEDELDMLVRGGVFKNY